MVAGATIFRTGSLKELIPTQPLVMGRRFA